MTAADFLQRLQGVRQTARGWSALCPAHPDKTPSLAIKEGERGVLLRCWAGCTVEEICAALGLEVKDLFSDSPLPRGQRPAPKPPKVDRRAMAFRFDLAGLDLRLRANRIIEAGKLLTVATLNEAELDQALDLIAQSYRDIERAELFEHVADTLRERDFNERTSRERPACAA